SPSLLDRGDPDWLPFPPVRIPRIGLVESKYRAAFRIEEVVVDDSVVCRVKAGYDRIVVGESIAGKRRDQRPGCRALFDQRAERRRFGRVEFRVVPAKTV